LRLRNRTAALGAAVGRGAEIIVALSAMPGNDDNAMMSAEEPVE
jgi:hypothetical protein